MLEYIYKQNEKDKMNKLNKKALSKAVDVELKRCFKCLGDFPKDALENVYNEIVDPALFCWSCAEDERESYYKTHLG